MDNELHIREWLSDYALGSLGKDEKGVVEAHLAHCEACQVELHSYQAVMGLLSLAAPEFEPPRTLKQAVLQKALKLPGAVQAGKKQPAPPARLAGFRHWLGGQVPVWGLLPVLLLAVALLTSTMVLWRQNQQYAMNRVSTFMVVDLTAASSASQATGWIVISRDGVSGTLIVEGLPPLAAGHQYQLWLVNGGTRASGAIFSVNSYGYASVWVKSPTPLIKFSSFGITIEPSGGSKGPTGPKVLDGKL
ncbi:MAG: anti-sigma factor [Chloroflexi bacterium]|nr:anti-sigma factor [Chloroflexota bacterium]